jgi:hypothetical protein
MSGRRLGNGILGVSCYRRMRLIDVTCVRTCGIICAYAVHNYPPNYDMLGALSS